MYLRRVTLDGFKSFAERTVVELGLGVNVIVGPNGSGKSNITDGILWALGEQSPSAVRSQAMQDVIFAGGPGLPPRRRAEVELVLDNSDQRLGVPLSELSICRRLGREGEGEYLLNGARCTLTEIHELLSDTGLGREAHSVVSQGRIESVVTARPEERRALIEEAAGLAKYRRRRQRAARRLARTAENLVRARDVEEEARARLRPLARQAKAAELQERLRRELLEARLALLGGELREARAAQEESQQRLLAARAERAALERQLQAVIGRREEAERLLAERAAGRAQADQAHYALQGALERAQLRAEQLSGLARALEAARKEGVRRLRELAGSPAREAKERQRALRVAELEAALSELREVAAKEAAAQSAALEEELQKLQQRVAQAQERLAKLRGEGDEGGSLRGQVAQAEVVERRLGALRKVLQEGLAEAVRLSSRAARERRLAELVEEVERLVREVVAEALAEADAAARLRRERAVGVAAAEREVEALKAEEGRLRAGLERAALSGQRGAEALKAAALEGELAVERRALAQAEEELAGQQAAARRLEALLAHREWLAHLALRAAKALTAVAEPGVRLLAKTAAEARLEREEVGKVAERLRAWGEEETGLQAQLRQASDHLTAAELDAQRTGAQLLGLQERLGALLKELGLSQDHPLPEPLGEAQRVALEGKAQRLERRLAAVGPINPLAKEEYGQAKAHVEELEAQRRDLEGALAELGRVIRETDHAIQERFAATFREVGERFREVVGEVFLGTSGRLLLVDQEREGGEEEPEEGEVFGGVEIELRHAGRGPRRLSLLSGGEKSMTALAFLFAIFLARPCPFYVLDEVEAALDDLNLERFIRLLRRSARGAQFLVVTHQRRTMEAADWLFGVSLGKDGVSKVVSRRMAEQPVLEGAAPGAARASATKSH